MGKIVDIDSLNIDKSNWLLTPLGDLASEISKRVDNPSDSDYEKFVGLEHFVSGDLKIRQWGSTENFTSSTKAFESGDILLARRNAYLRRASLVSFDGVCSGDAFVLRENHERVVPGFLAFVVNSNSLWDFANANAAGTMSKRVKWRDLANYEFLLPPKEQQAEIAQLLWAADDVVEKERDVHKALEAYCKSKALKLLGLRGEIYGEKWEEKKISDIAPLQRGFDLTNGNLVQGKFPVCYSNGIRNYHAEAMVKGPGVCTGRSGTIGNVFYIEEDYWPHNTTLWVTDFKDNDPKYIYYLYSYLDFSKKMAGTGVPTLNRNDVHKMSTFIPGKNRQVEIRTEIEKINERLTASKSYCVASKALQKSLINQVF